MRKKFTMLLTALLCCVGGAKAQITSLGELNNGKAYTIVGNRGFIAANEGFVMGSNYGPLSGANLETNNAMHQFAIITYENVSYLYSVGAEKFVMKDGNKASLVDFPIHSIEIVAAQDQSTNFDWIIKLNGKYMNLSNSSENGVYTNYDSEDDGNRWSITEIGEFNSQKAEAVISLGLASERLALQKAINNASSYYEAMKDKNTEEAKTLNNMISVAQGSLTSDAETAESLSEKILNIDLLLYNLISEYDLSSQAFYLKNASTGLYMTLVSTNENIKVCDFDYTNENQIFNIVGTNESYVYKVKSSTGYYLKTTGYWDYKASETDDDGGKHTLAYVGEGKYTLTGSNGLIGPNSGSAKNNDPIYSNHGTNNSNIYWVLEPQDERLKSILLEEIESATTVYDKLKSFTCDEITTLVTAINTANGVYKNPSATVDAIIEQIGSLSTAKDEASLYPFVPSLLKEIEPSRYFIYYTDENNTKHYLQTTGANSVVTVTENPISYDIQAGTTEDGKFTTAYTIKMNGLYISNTSNDATNIETKDQVQLWSSQVVFEMNGKSAIRLTNATAENTWHGHYFINKGDENTTIASDPSLGENLFIWTIEPDLQGMRDELAVLKEKATTLITQLTNKPEGSAPIENAVITALSTAIEYAEANKDSNNSETLNTGITQLNDAINNASVNAFGSGVLAMLDEGEYIIYSEKGNTKYYLSNNKTDKIVVTSTSPLVYDVYKGQTDGYATYAYCLDMNESKMSNPNGDMQIQVENKGGNNYNNNREWDSQVLYVNSQGKYAIRSTNCPAGSGWNSDAFITISEDGKTVSGQNTDLSDALYIWNIEKVNAEASINNVKYETLTAAIAAAEADATVTMLKDINVENAVQVAKDLTINMNGKTLTSAGDGFEVTARGTLTITGEGTVNAGVVENPTEDYVAVWANGGNVIINGGTFIVAAGKDGETNDCIYAKGGEITINGGTFSNAGTYNPSHGGVVINANNTVANSKVIINGGTINPAEGCVAYEVADVEAGRIELNTAAKVGNQYYTSLDAAIAAAEANATVTMLNDINVSSAVVVAKNLTIDMNGKTLTSAGDGFEVTAGTLTITGNGTVAAGTTGDQWVAVWANGGNAVIENGTYSVVADENNTTNDCIYAKGGQITVNGGTFSNVGTYVANKGGVVINANNTVANSKVIINGGTINPAEGCVAYEVADVEAGRIELNTAAKVGNQYYTSLDAAIAAAEANATVTMLNDINVSSAVVVAKNLTIDMNGKTLTSAGDGFEVTAGTLTITGNGTVAAGTTGDQWVAVWANGGNAVIENGTYSVVADENNTTNDCIYAKGGQITVNGGTFSNVGTYVAGNGGVVINAHNTIANSKVIINGGTFNPAEGCVPYEVADVEADRVVLNSVANETELKIAVAAGKDVTLGADIEVSSAVQVADVINLDLNGNTITNAEGYVFEVTGELTVNGGSLEESAICYIINDADYKTEAGKTYAISEDKEYVDIKYTRTFGHNSWQVLFVPFDIEVTEELLNDFEVYTITGVNEVRVEVADVTVGTTLSAHTPYLIKVQNWTEENKTKTITVTDATLEATNGVYNVTKDNYTFTGIYTSEAIAAHDKYVLTDGKWCRLSDKAVEDGNNVLGAFRVYLTAPANAANALSITRGETGIEELSTVNDQQSTVIYDLTGRKVETMDKGIYIVNGRKVVK